MPENQLIAFLSQANKNNDGSVIVRANRTLGLSVCYYDQLFIVDEFYFPFVTLKPNLG